MVDIAERRRVIDDGEGREGLDRLVRENWRIEVVVKKVEGVTLISRRRANVVLGGSFQTGLNLPRGLCVVCPVSCPGGGSSSTLWIDCLGAGQGVHFPRRTGGI